MRVNAAVRNVRFYTDNSMHNVSNFVAGQEVEFPYTQPPVAAEMQFPVGELAEILDDQGRVLARFRVSASDPFKNRGVIVWVSGAGGADGQA